MRVNYKLACKLLSFIIFCIASQIIVGEDAKQKGYLNVAGAKLYYQIFGIGEPIIILHGGPGLGFGYLLPQMLELSKDHELIFYDQRGSGKSLDTPINERTINMKRFVADLEAIRKNLDYKKIILFGHSWGGLLAMNYAIAYPQHVRAMILANSAPATRAGFLKFIKEYDRRTAPISDKLYDIQDSPQFMSGDTATIEKYYSLIFANYFADPGDVDKLSLKLTPLSALNGFKVAAIMQRNYLSNQFDLLPALAKLKIPTLIVYGAEDLMPLDAAMQINHAIPNSQLLVIENSGHFSYIEQPEEFFTTLENFLKKNQ